MAEGGRSLAEVEGRGHSVVVDASQLAAKLALDHRPLEEVVGLFCRRMPLLVVHDRVVGDGPHDLVYLHVRNHFGNRWALLRLQPTRQGPFQLFRQQALEAELAASPDCHGVSRPARDCRYIAVELLVLPEVGQS